MVHLTQISRVVLRNYKSIRHCDVRLEPITFLVGPNGAGKSNFVEALRFLSYGLSTTLENAVENRSGIQSILYRGMEAASTFSFAISFRLTHDVSGSYEVEIGSLEDGGVAVVEERCVVESAQRGDWFKRSGTMVVSNQAGTLPAPSDDKLYLVNASGVSAFEPVYRLLTRLAVYNPVPDEIRGFKPERRYPVLDRTGSALAEALFRMKTSAPDRLSRVTQYLQRINPSILGVDAISVDANYNLRLKLDRGGGLGEDFSAQNLSDGTLRALAILIAFFQKSERYPLTLVGLEEPEAGLHPAAAGVLFDSLIEGSQLTQIVVTSHSPDLLDRNDIPEDSLRAVALQGGSTVIGEVDAAAKAALRDRLYTAGELMRMDQLRPETITDLADA